MKDPRALIYDLASNSALREEFCSSPSEILKQYGFNPDILELPKSFDSEKLKSKLNQILAGDSPEDSELENVGNMSPQELWEKLLVMRTKQEFSSTDKVVTPVIVAVYGTVPAAVGDTIRGGGSNLLPEQTFEQLQELEEAAPHEIKISISGPNGKSVDNLAPHVAGAFIKRLLRKLRD